MELFGEYKELHLTEQRWFDGQWVPRPTLEKFGVVEPEWVEERGSGEEVKPCTARRKRWRSRRRCGSL